MKPESNCLLDVLFTLPDDFFLIIEPYREFYPHKFTGVLVGLKNSVGRIPNTFLNIDGVYAWKVKIKF